MMRVTAWLMLLALWTPALAMPGLADDDAEDVPVLQRLVTVNAKDQSRAEIIQDAFAQAGVRLEIDRPAVALAGLDINEKLTRDFGQTSLHDVLLSIIDTPRIAGVYVTEDGDGWVLTSLATLKTRQDTLLPEWLRDGPVRPSVTPGGRIHEVLLHGSNARPVLERLHELDSLRKLTISTELAPADLRHLEKVTSLREVDVQSRGPMGAPLGDAAIEALATLPSLRSLSLSQTLATDKGIERLAAFPALRDLSIYQESRLTDASLKTIGSLERLESLSLITFVRIEREGVAAFSPEGYAALSGLRNLKRLALIHAFQPPSIKDLHFPKLKSISLSGESVGDDVALHLATMPTLERIVFERDVLTNEGLGHLARLPSLRELQFSSQAVTPAGLAALQQLPALEELRSWLTPSDELVQQLAGCKALRRLKLAGCPSPRGIQMLSTLPQLSSLEVSGVMTEGHFVALRGMKALRHLTLNDANITQERLDQLRRELPDVRIQASRPFTGGFSREPPLR